MLSRIRQMHKLVELADIELDKAVKHLAALQVEHSEIQEQLQALIQYAAELSTQQAGGEKQVVHVIDFQVARGFSEKLYQAIDAQKEKEARLANQVVQARDRWQEKKMRKEALSRLLDKLKQKYQQIQEKKEQQALDELAAQRVVAQRTSYH